MIGDYRKDYLESSHNHGVFLTFPWLTRSPLLHRQYLVLVPSQLYTGVPEKACVMLNHLNETMTLNIILDYGMQISTLLTKLVTEKNYFSCSPFTVSRTLWDMEAR